MPIEPGVWLDMLAAELAREVTPTEAFRAFTNNTELLGAYAEGAVRRLIERCVAPLRVSTGAIIHEKISPTDVPQLDCIVWGPLIWPGLFEAGDFALVPSGSAIGFLEVKASAYHGVAERLAPLLMRADELLGNAGYVHHSRAMGVICVHYADQSIAPLADLIRSEQVVCLIEANADGSDPRPNRPAFVALVNFLLRLRRVWMDFDGMIPVANLPVTPREPA